ncbi:MAG: VOC family protein [Polaromonas sp.]|uniref:VOC family protein n=1 Tax=Polaromonas sp. TaxID=1869339 RepID=UPI0024898711|nr:VOC family protein [Polaromonas sp.]MDI1238603.1 VOC family protein [Polaromonas sp.]MDI1341516.1 VOC family protein [Polaromonas sp.]
MPTCLDHITVVAPSLDAGSRFVHQALGIEPFPGRKHPDMGTHNRLLALGERVYLEVIAPDPDAPPVARPRWFGLDQVSRSGIPRLAAWVAGTDNIESAVIPEMGTVETMSRAGFTWQMTLTADGSVPFQGAVPALIQRSSHDHPASRLADVGLRLRRLRIHHPEPAQVLAAFARMGLAPWPEVAVFYANACSLVAEIETPAGPRELGLLQ